MLPNEYLYLSTEEEIRQTVHVLRGANMLALSTISRQDVEVMAREAERALQETIVHIVEELARLTQETRTTIGRVEEDFGDMDSRMEYMKASL